MAIIKSGSGDDTCLEVDPTFDAALASYRGPDASGGGYYRASLVSGTIATLAAAGIVYGFQYQGTGKAMIAQVSIGGRPLAGNTSQAGTFSLYFTRSYTAMDTTGAATAVSYKGQYLAQTRSTQMNSIFRISNTGAMSGGTGTDDSQPLSSVVMTHPGSVSTMSNFPFFQVNTAGISLPIYPLTLAQNEGFRIRADTTPIAGSNTMVLMVDVEWFEASSF